MEESKNIKSQTKENFTDEKVLELNIDNYEGPLDLLLDLAKTQKVDLMQISIVQLADQYISFVERIKKNLDPKNTIYKLTKKRKSGYVVSDLNDIGSSQRNYCELKIINCRKTKRTKKRYKRKKMCNPF